MQQGINVAIKKNGSWVSRDITPVFPFKFGELLDERLDEGQLVIFSLDKYYEPLTEVWIRTKDLSREGDLYDKAVDEYYIVANDNSAEFPAGSGKYRHELYLIERTKLLEGVVCQSITFTNSIAKKFSKIRNRVFAEIESGLDTSAYQGYSEITTPIDANSDYQCPALSDVGDSVVNAIKDDNPGDWSFVFSTYDGDESSLSISLDGQIYEQDLETYTLTPEELKGHKTLTLTYRLWFRQVLAYPTQTNFYLATVNFTIQIVELEKYGLVPWTITECVNRVLELCNPLYGVDSLEPKYKFEGVTYIDKSVTDASSNTFNIKVADTANYTGQALKYNNIFAPEFTMTQGTLREQLKVIGSYIHAEPWLDENNVIHFLEYGQQKQTKAISNNTPYVSSVHTTDINQYCTEIKSNAQNLVSSLDYAKGVIIEPSDGLYRSLRCEDIYKRIDDTNGVFATDFPIYSISSIKLGAIDDVNGFVYEPKEANAYLFERTEYENNLDSFEGGYPYSKSYALYYTQGEKNIRGLFFQAPDAKSTSVFSPWAIANIIAAINNVTPMSVYNNLVGSVNNSGAPRLVCQITYQPIAPAFISHSKQLYIKDRTPYAIPYNQSENVVESAYFGENMKGVAARLGNVEQTKTYLLNYRSQVPKVGEMIDGYAISAVSCEILPTFIKCTLGLTKDFNRISEYVSVSSVKRMYEISERQAVTRDVLIKEDVVITKSSSAQTNDSGVFFEKTFGFVAALAGGGTPGITDSGITATPIRGAYFKGFKRNLTPVIDSSISNDYNSSLFLPCLGRSFGNSVHLSFRMKDNYSAGEKAVKIENSDYSNLNGYWQDDIPYTDFYGRIYFCGIALAVNITNIDNSSTGISRARSASLVLPDNEETNLESDSFINPSWVSNDKFQKFYRIRKDNRESISFNIEAELKTDIEGLIIGSKLAERCGFIVQELGETPVIIFSNIPPNKFENKKGSDSGIDEFDTSDDSSQDGSAQFNAEPGSADITITTGYEYETVQEFKYFYIVTQPETVLEKYSNEDGEIESVYVRKGGDVLLSGTTNLFEPFEHNGVEYGRLALRFITKRS